MIEKIPVTKYRKFKTFLKIMSLPILISTIAFWINYDFVLSEIDKKYESYLIWKHNWFNGMDATTTHPVSLDKKGVIFDEILEPQWKTPYSLLFVANKIGAPAEWGNNLLPDDLYADLLVEIDQIDKNGSIKRIITLKSTHQIQSRINGLREIMASWSLPAGSDATGVLKHEYGMEFERGKKYHIRITNQSINPDLLNKPYEYNITLTNRNSPK